MENSRAHKILLLAGISNVFETNTKSLDIGESYEAPLGKPALDMSQATNMEKESNFDLTSFSDKESQINEGIQAYSAVQSNSPATSDSIVPPSNSSEFDNSFSDPNYSPSSSDNEVDETASTVNDFSSDDSDKENKCSISSIPVTLNTSNKSEEFHETNQQLSPKPSTSTANTNIIDNVKTSRPKDFCYFCETFVLNFARHLKRNHPAELEVQKIFSRPCKSKERKTLLAVLRKKGNYLVNSHECVRPMKRTKNSEDKNYLPCVHCLGFYTSKQLWRHRQTCVENPGTSNCKSQAEAQNFIVRNFRIDARLRETVFPHMRADRISLVAKKDSLICAFGSRYIQIHREKHFINVASRKMRELSKLLIELRKLEPSIKTLFQALDPRYYDRIVEATKMVAKYDNEKEIFLSPTYAMNISTSLKQCCNIAIIYALKKKDVYENVATAEAEAKLKTMIKLLEAHWKYDVSTRAADDLHMQKWNKVTIVPLASDIKLLKEYLTRVSNDAVSRLVDNNRDDTAYKVLIETIYCRVLLLNRKRPGELQRLLLHYYESAEVNEEQNYEEIGQALSPTEKILMKRFKRIVIRGKRSRGVPVLFSTDVQEHIDILLKYRPNFTDKSNPYLFALPNLNSVLCGYKVFKKYVNGCGAKNAKAITSTKLRKHLATLTQIFNMTDNDIEQLATFMGHTSAVHRKSYRLPDDLYQTAKISKLLLLMEKGDAAKYAGKSLDDIQINLEENLLETEQDTEADHDSNISESHNNNEQTVTEQNSSNNILQANIEEAKTKKKRILVPWSTEQKQIVEDYFKIHIKNKIPPKKRECEKLKEMNPDVLQNKNWLKIKVYIQNKYKNK